MKKLIKKIKAKFSRKPLLVIPAVSCSFVEGETVIFDREAYKKQKNSPSFMYFGSLLCYKQKKQYYGNNENNKAKSR